MISLDDIDKFIDEAKKASEKAAEGASDYAGHTEYKRYHRLLRLKRTIEMWL